MYPQKSIRSLKITSAFSEVEAIRDALRGAILALEVEKSSMADTQQDAEADLQAILGLGVLLNDLQTRRLRVQELSRALPSPNQVTAKMRARVVTLGKLLFETAEHIRNIQSETYRLARLNMRAAAHKMKAQRMACVA
jgi:hypothetical protein